MQKPFIPNPLGYNEINHKDENKTNNKVDNLEWCSHDYNINYSFNPSKKLLRNRKKKQEYIEMQKEIEKIKKKRLSNRKYLFILMY